MSNSGLLSASLIICESVLSEKTGVLSAIRIMDFLTVAPGSDLAHFFVLTYLRSLSSDRLQHILKVQMVGPGGIVADAPEHKFLYGYALDANSPGGFVLTTEFNLNLTNLGALGTYYVQALVDGAMVQQAPLTLRRRG